MEVSGQQRRRREGWIAWGAVACFCIVFSCCIPITCDDWYYVSDFFNKKMSENPGILEMFTVGRQLTGRTLFWLIGFGVMKSGALRVLTQALTLFAIALGMAKLSGLSKRGGYGLSLVVVFMLLLPSELLRETYAWHIGFLNYVPPVVLLLLYLWCIYPLFSGRRVQDTAWKCVLCLLLGVCIQLFSEPITVYVVVMAFGVIVWHAVRTRKVSVATVLFGVGAIIGAILMFTAPAMRNALRSNGSYYAAPTSLGMLLYILKHNYPIFSYYSLANSTLLLAAISACSLLQLWRNGAQDAAKEPWRIRLRKWVSVLLIALPAYAYLMSETFDLQSQSSPAFLALTQFFNSIYCAIAFDALLYLLYAASVACVLLFFTKDTLRRNLGLFSMASALIISAPMLVVQPIPYRCFYAPYILWALVALLLIDGVLDGVPEKSRLLRGLVIPGIYAAAAVTCAFYLMIYARCPEINRARIDHIEREMALGAKEIVLPQYACAEYLHLSDDAVEVCYHYETINDVKFRFIPYDQWRNEVADAKPSLLRENERH